MSAFVADSRCECQASLRAELDASRLVVRGSAFLRGKREVAPAHSIGAAGIAAGADADNFQIAWSCPFCSRNVLRSFAAGALARVNPAASA
jgi:hypothetical protein